MNRERAIDRSLRMMRVVMLAMIVGTTAFLAFASFVAKRGPAPMDWSFANSPISLTALAFAPIALLIGALLPRLIVRDQLKRLGAGRFVPPETPNAGSVTPEERNLSGMLAISMTAILIPGSLFEAASFLGSMGWMLEGKAYALWIAIAMIFAMLAIYPRQGALQAKLDAMGDELEQLRRLQETTTAPLR